MFAAVYKAILSSVRDNTYKVKIPQVTPAVTKQKLIHSANPQSRPVGIIVFAHSYVCPSVRPHFLKQNKFQAKTMFATVETVGLPEWIIDNTCLVDFIFAEVQLNKRVIFGRQLHNKSGDQSRNEREVLSANSVTLQPRPKISSSN